MATLPEEIMRFVLHGNPLRALDFTSIPKNSNNFPYNFTGRSYTHRGHVRQIKKAQRRRAFLRSLKG
jgi:hypothetical protein